MFSFYLVYPCLRVFSNETDLYILIYWKNLSEGFIVVSHEWSGFQYILF